MADALQLIRQDHQRVQELFREFQNSEDNREKKRIADQAILELQVHALMEEEVFYPAMKRQLGDVELLHEANEEHHVAELLMDELKGMRQINKQYDAKFGVLVENVKHHIQEEESEILPKAAEAGREQLQRLGEQLEQRKMELMQEMQSGGARRSAVRRSAAAKKSSSTRKSTARKSGGTRSNGRRTTRTTARSTRAGGGTRSSGRTTRKSTSSGRKSTSTRSGTRSAASRSRSTNSRSRSTSGRTTSGRSTSGRKRSTAASKRSR